MVTKYPIFFTVVSVTSTVPSPCPITVARRVAYMSWSRRVHGVVCEMRHGPERSAAGACVGGCCERGSVVVVWMFFAMECRCFRFVIIACRLPYVRVDVVPILFGFVMIVTVRDRLMTRTEPAFRASLIKYKWFTALTVLFSAEARRRGGFYRGKKKLFSERRDVFSNYKPTV